MEDDLDEEERVQLKDLLNLSRVQYLRLFKLDHSQLLSEELEKGFSLASPVIWLAKARMVSNMGNWKSSIRHRMKVLFLGIPSLEIDNDLEATSEMAGRKSNPNPGALLGQSDFYDQRPIFLVPDHNIDHIC